MKKLKYLVVLLIAALIIPFTIQVKAEGEESKEVKVYFFRGEGCSHCQEAEEWFDSVKGEYGDLFTIVDYETW